MDDQRFRIVFEKLRESAEEGSENPDDSLTTVASEEEMDSIAELRRVLLDLCDGEVTYHTTT